MNCPNNKSVAIVGISCRFPKIHTPTDFWRVLLNGEDVITKVPGSRWNVDDYYDPDKRTPHKTNQDAGGFLEDIHYFDNQLFNISPIEAYEMSPSQKLILELAWELIENSSVSFNKISGSNTGVYIGNIWSDFEHLRKEKNAEINNFSALGMSPNLIANRISYFLGLTGPSFILDTGCSSSLVAAMQSVEALQNGVVDMAITGGINHLIDPEKYIYLAKFGGLSSKGRCSTFDADADGFVRAEGAGLVLLKRLEDAEKEGDIILTVIRGGAINNNGFNTTMQATSSKGQLHLLEQAYRNAGVKTADVQYIETHGTGTKLGDPVEAKAIGEFFSEQRQGKEELLIGSVKSNIGHSEGASGIAGLLKVVLAMKNHIIPKNLHFNTPNPKIKFSDWILKVPAENQPWPGTNGKPHLAGISSFGWGGTNAHMVLEEYKSNERNIHKPFSQKYFVLPVSAKSENAFKEYVKKTVEYLTTRTDKSDLQLRQICSGFALQKPSLEYRKSFYGRNKNEIIKQLETFSQSDTQLDPRETKTAGKTVFVFPGQGSQWIGMGKKLYHSQKVFRESLDACEPVIKKHTGWSLKGELNATADYSNLHEIQVIQPCIFAVQVSLARLWISMGVSPDTVVGHSMGEVAAACVAGILSLEDAAGIICIRSRLMQQLSGKGGAMMVTELNKTQAGEIAEKYNGLVSVAVTNSPKSTVLAGDEGAILDILSRLEKEDLFCRKVKVDVASHSPQMDQIKEELFLGLRGITPCKAKIPFYSTVRNKRMHGSEMDADYWTENLRNTVRFDSVLQQLLENDSGLFIEISPHPVLKTPVEECAAHFNANPVTVLGSMHRERDNDLEFLRNFLLVFEEGFTVDWDKYYNYSGISALELPAYPMQKNDFEIKSLRGILSGKSGRNPAHPFLDEQIDLAGTKHVHWHTEISLKKLPYLEHHRINDEIVFPGGFYIEMVHFAVTKKFPDLRFSIQNIRFLESVYLKSDGVVGFQLMIRIEKERPVTFRFYKKITSDSSWEICCKGDIVKPAEELKPFIKPPVSSYKLSRKDIYEGFERLGIFFGETFQNIHHTHGDDNTAESKLVLNENLIPDRNKFSLHPLLLDNMLHPVFINAFTAFKTPNIISTFVTGIDCIEFSKNVKLTPDLHLATSLQPPEYNENKTSISICGDVAVKNNRDEMILACRDIRAKAFDTGMQRKADEKIESKDIMIRLDQLHTTREKVEVILKETIKLIARAIKSDPDNINSGSTFRSLGLDSLTTLQLRNLFEKTFKVRLAVKDFAKYTSPRTFAWFLHELITNNLSRIKSNTPQNPWFVSPHKSSKSEKQLLLFHDAGGSSKLFEEWELYFDNTIELMIIELPGHGERRDEKPVRDFNEMMKQLMPVLEQAIQKPCSIYGHSMGGLLAYEAACALQNKYNKTTENLIISGTPYLYRYDNVLINTIVESDMPDSELQSLIPGLKNDTNPEIIKQILQTIRSDFQLIYSYHYNNNTVLDSNITAIHASDDDRVKLADTEKWKKATNRNFRLEQTSGGHAFVYNAGKYTADIILKTMTANTPPEKNSLPVQNIRKNDG